jgi:hypothetical protein
VKHELLGTERHPQKMPRDELAVRPGDRVSSVCLQAAADGIDHGCLQRGRRHPADRSGRVFAQHRLRRCAAAALARAVRRAAELAGDGLDKAVAALRRAYVLADNKLALNAGWDPELLAIELQGLISAEFDIELTGFSAAEIELVLDAAAEGAPTGPDEDAEDHIPEPADDPAPQRPGDSVAGKPGLHRREQVAVEDRLMFSLVNLAPVHDLADVEPVLEQMRQRPAPEADAARTQNVRKIKRLQVISLGNRAGFFARGRETKKRVMLLSYPSRAVRISYPFAIRRYQPAKSSTS